MGPDQGPEKLLNNALDQLRETVDRLFLKYGFNRTTHKFDKRPERVEISEQSQKPARSTSPAGRVEHTQRLETDGGGNGATARPKGTLARSCSTLSNLRGCPSQLVYSRGVASYARSQESRKTLGRQRSVSRTHMR